MQNKYESPDVIHIGQAPSEILGEKMEGTFDWINGDERTVVVNPMTDIDE